MVSNNEKVQGAGDLHPGSVKGVDHRFPFCKAVGRIRICISISGQKSICGIGCVEVRISPKQLCVRGTGGEA